MTDYSNSIGQADRARDESGSFESAAVFYDEKVQVRSPYTGQLESPRVIVNFDDLTSSRTSYPTRRTRRFEGSVPAVVDEGYDVGERRWLGRLRIAGAGFAFVVVIGAAAFTVMGARKAPAVKEAIAGDLAGVALGPGSAPAPSGEPAAEERDEPEARDTLTSLNAPVLLSSAAEETEEEAAPVEKNVPSDSPAAEEPGSASKETVEAPAAQAAETSDIPAVTDGAKGDASAVADGAKADIQSPEGYEALLERAKKVRRGKARIALLREAIAVNPSGDEALARLSILLMELPKTRNEALALAERAVSVNDQNAAAWLVIGYVKQMAGAMGEAKKAYAKCAAASGPQKYVRECRSLI